ncbi:MAG TPA: JDVT-CTERM system CAAX-type protease [Desulfonatronum sp.]|nr:JDVT-CTERM system CAAX-type protease [Desulfonatronum sp.]
MNTGESWYRDWRYFAVLALGLLAWALPEPALRIAWWRLAVLALAEEIVFRGLLQRELSRVVFLSRRIGPLSLANVLASAVFAAVHLIAQPLVWAAAVFAPSLIFGWIWDRYQRIAPCWLAHFLFNFWFFYRL